MPLDPSALLRVVPELTVRCRSSSEFVLKIGPRRLQGGPHTLAILNAFRTPRSFTAALEMLKSQLAGAHDWMDLTAAIMRFHREGVLLDERTVNDTVSLNASGDGFGSAPIHIAMLNDRERSSRYLEAIRQTVRPGDVVVDLGTGSGLLAVAAAQAGAARVYAIEATAMARVAQRMFLANGVADRITLIEGYSTQVQLPERADVLVAEIIGSDPLAEKILECTCDAVRRFLKPDARLIPSALEVMAVPVEIPAPVRDQKFVADQALSDWQAAYGIDFSPLQVLARDTTISFFEKPATVATWTQLAEPQVISTFDLTHDSQPSREMTAVFEVLRDGRIDGLVIWFRAKLTADSSLTTDPRALRPDNHWMHPVYLMPDPVAVRSGSRANVRIEGNEARTVRIRMDT